MRVLAHVHTFNDADFIEQALDALQRQTRPPDAIVIVDNASTDGTLNRALSEGVTVIRNSTNLGSSGAVKVGFAHALAQEFDWTWVLDADSVPEPDALENLLGFFERLPPSQREQVCFLACRLATDTGGMQEQRPIILTQSSLEFVPLDADAGYCRCDCFMWSGSLFRMQAVVKIGLPSADYFIDLSELEYGYRARQLGLTGYIVNSGVLHQDVGRPPGIGPEPGASVFFPSGSTKFRRCDVIIASAICCIFGCISTSRTDHAGFSAASFMPSSSRGHLLSGLSVTGRT